MDNRSTGLGKGLDALIPKKTNIMSSSSNDEHVFEISIESVRPNPRQPRTDFAPEELNELTASIRQHGILQPLVVIKVGSGYELIAGERRLRAAKAVGLKMVPVVVRAANDQAKLELSLIENIQRQNLNPMEEARAFRALADDFYLTHEDIARRVGKTRSVVSNTVRLLDLPRDIQDALAAGKINYASARALISLPEIDQRRVFEQLMRGEKLTTRDIEKKSAPQRRTIDPNIAAAESALREALETRVTVNRRGKRGSILIEFFSDEELKRILERFI